MHTSLVATPTSNERLAAVIAHGGTLVAWFLAPLLVYVLKRGDSRWVEEQALQALLWSAIGTAASLLTCGLAIPVFAVFHIMAAVKAYAGEPFEYPFVRRLVQ